VVATPLLDPSLRFVCKRVRSPLSAMEVVFNAGEDAEGDIEAFVMGGEGIELLPVHRLLGIGYYHNCK